MIFLRITLPKAKPNNMIDAGSGTTPPTGITQHLTTPLNSSSSKTLSTPSDYEIKMRKAYLEALYRQEKDAAYRYRDGIVIPDHHADEDRKRYCKIHKARKEIG